MIDQEQGLPSNAVYNLMVDREGAIWAALRARHRPHRDPSPASFFDEADGFSGAFNTTITRAGSIWRGKAA